MDAETSLTYSSAFLALIGPLFTVIIGAVSAGLEFGPKTSPSVAGDGVKRWQLWLAKLSSVMIVVAAWVAASLMIGYLCSVWVTGHFGAPLVNVAVLTQLGVLLSTLMFWAVFSFTCALAFRGSAAGIALGLLFPFANMMFDFAGGIRLWLPVWNQRALNAAAWGVESRGVTSFFPDPGYPPASQAATVLAVMLIVMMMASFYLMRRLRPE